MLHGVDTRRTRNQPLTPPTSTPSRSVLLSCILKSPHFLCHCIVFNVCLPPRSPDHPTSPSSIAISPYLPYLCMARAQLVGGGDKDNDPPSTHQPADSLARKEIWQQGKPFLRDICYPASKSFKRHSHLTHLHFHQKPRIETKNGRRIPDFHTPFRRCHAWVRFRHVAICSW